MKDISQMTPVGGVAPAAPVAQVYGAPAQDVVQVALTWRVALERKATDADLAEEPAPFRNLIVQGALSWLQGYEGDFDYLLNLRANLNPRYGLSPRQACGVLNCMAAEARRKAPAPVAGAPAAPAGPARMAVEDAGVYVLPDGTVCRVQVTRDKGRTYAKRWTPIKHLDRLMEAGGHEHGEYVYEQGLVQEVARVGRRMTLEEAKAWSVRIGKCIRCGRTLTDGKSVEAGLGPVCIKWFQGA